MIAWGVWKEALSIFGLDRPPWLWEPRVRSGVKVYRIADGSYVRGLGFDYRSDAEYVFGLLERMVQDCDPVEFEDKLSDIL